MVEIARLYGIRRPWTQPQPDDVARLRTRLKLAASRFSSLLVHSTSLEGPQVNWLKLRRSRFELSGIASIQNQDCGCSQTTAQLHTRCALSPPSNQHEKPTYSSPPNFVAEVARQYKFSSPWTQVPPDALARSIMSWNLHRRFVSAS